jgi:Rrf2 family iron-sulfur cluster assembly transcriptional regulator
MLDLALHCERSASPARLNEIASRQDIPRQYLDQLFAKLRQRGLVTGRRGPGGGYRPARASDQISVADIVDAVDERTDATACGGLTNCRNGRTCLTHYLWQDLSQQIRRFLAGMSLAELADREDIQRVVAAQRREAAAREEADTPFGSIMTTTAV